MKTRYPLFFDDKLCDGVTMSPSKLLKSTFSMLNHDGICWPFEYVVIYVFIHNLWWRSVHFRFNSAGRIARNKNTDSLYALKFVANFRFLTHRIVVC